MIFLFTFSLHDVHNFLVLNANVSFLLHFFNSEIFFDRSSSVPWNKIIWLKIHTLPWPGKYMPDVYIYALNFFRQTDRLRINLIPRNCRMNDDYFFCWTICPNMDINKQVMHLVQVNCRHKMDNCPLISLTRLDVRSLSIVRLYIFFIRCINSK